MKLGLIGKAIMNSSSPDLHVRLGQLTGIPTTYDLFDANEQPIKSLAKQVDKVIAAGYRWPPVYPRAQKWSALPIHWCLKTAKSSRRTQTLPAL